MAKILTHIDEARGLTVEHAYWNVKFIQVNIRKFQSPSITFHFDGFASQAAADSGKQPVAQKVVEVTDPAKLQGYLGRHLAGQVNLMGLAYEVADERGLFDGGIDDVDAAVAEASQPGGGEE